VRKAPEKTTTKTVMKIDCAGLTDHQSAIMFEVCDVLNDASIEFAFKWVASDEGNKQEAA